MDERELLKAYAERADQEAFAQLVGRNGDWVYASARRQVRDEHLAEDVTQAVFLLLAQRAGRLGEHPKLGGWLFGSLGHCVRHARRERGRRVRREKEAAAMRREAMPVEASWEEVAVVLDDAVAGLRPADREAVLMRFYQGMSFAQVGQASGIGEEAAKKRVQRAVERLREMLESKGVTGTTAGLSAVLVGNVVGEAPASLVKGILKAMGGGNPVASGIAKGAMKMMVRAKVMVAGVVVAFVLAGSGVVMRVAAAGSAGTESSATMPAAPAVAPSVQVEVLVRGSAQERHLYELLYLLRHRERGPKGDLFDHFDQFDQWCDAIRQVVEIGKPAVPYLVAELDSTKSDFCMRNVAFALRAIGDPRAVPALLRAMPRCAFASGSDMGVPLANPQLAEFMVRNGVGGMAPQVPDAAKRAASTSLAFYYYRPIVEIDAALRKLTGYSEGDAHLRAKPFGKTDAEQQAVRDVYSATAARWQKWWDQNHGKLISDQELATVQLPAIQGDPIEAAGKAKFGDLTGADLPLGPMGIDRLGTRFRRISTAVNQKDAKAVSDAVAGTLDDYRSLAEQAAERQASGNPVLTEGEVVVVADHPERRVALLEDMQKAVQAGDWARAKSLDAKLTEMRSGISTFARLTMSPAAAPVVAPRQPAAP